MRALVAALLLGLCPGLLAAQASSYIPLDDPRLPLLEHLIARGDVPNPSPMERPLLRHEVVTLLEFARDSAALPATSLEQVEWLIGQWKDPEAKNRWRVELRGGAQAYAQPRRDVFHPVGEEGVNFYADARLEAFWGNIGFVTRPATEQRVVSDPDWLGRRDLDLAFRLVDGYVTGQWKYGRFAFGQLDQNWGPVGLPGLPISNYAYDRQGLHVGIGTRKLGLSAITQDLRDGVDSTGTTVKRYYTVKRLHWQTSDKLTLGLWEGTLWQGENRNWESRFMNIVAPSFLVDRVGAASEGINNFIGFDVSWRAFGRNTFELQFGLDDVWTDNRDVNRDRWALTAMGYGPLAGPLAWRAWYSQVSSLALRAFDPAENLTDGGVGLGRNFSDNDHFGVQVSWPALPGWLVTPELALFRQGEGKINDPYPPLPLGPDFPALFIGTVERTWRGAVGISGQQGPLQVTASGAVHRVENVGNVEGVDDWRFEGRIQATLGIFLSGAL